MDSVSGGDFGDTERGTPFNDIHNWNSRFLFFYVCHGTQLSLVLCYWTSTKTGIHSRNDPGCYVLFHSVWDLFWTENPAPRCLADGVKDQNTARVPLLVNLTSKWQFARCCCRAWSGLTGEKILHKDTVYTCWFRSIFLVYLDDYPIVNDAMPMGQLTTSFQFLIILMFQQ